MKDKVYKFLKTYGLLLICTLLLGYGNNKLTYPVGLTFSDEAAFAGAVRYNKDGSSTNNSSLFMYTGEWNWTMTPGYYSYKKVLFYVAEYADVV